jgi:hypothetical protein
VTTKRIKVALAAALIGPAAAESSLSRMARSCTPERTPASRASARTSATAATTCRAGGNKGGLEDGSPNKYSQCGPATSFDANRYYEAKAWAMMQQWRAATKPNGTVLFWCVTGSPQA